LHPSSEFARCFIAEKSNRHQYAVVGLVTVCSNWCNFRLVEVNNQTVEALLGEAMQAISGSLKRSTATAKPPARG